MINEICHFINYLFSYHINFFLFVFKDGYINYAQMFYELISKKVEYNFLDQANFFQSFRVDHHEHDFIDIFD